MNYLKREDLLKNEDKLTSNQIKSNQVYLVTAKYQINDKTTVTRAS